MWLTTNMSLLALVESGNKEALQEKLDSIRASNSNCFREFHERSPQSHNALDLAAVLGRTELLEMLIEYGADINTVNKSGYSAMHYSAAWGRLECLQILAEKGAESSGLTRYKETPKDLAERYGKQDCLTYLIFNNECKKLRNAVNKRRGTLTETERISGKWNKEDKSKITALCNEKSDWLDKRKRDSTLDEVQQQIEDFEQKMEPYVAKLAV